MPGKGSAIGGTCPLGGGPPSLTQFLWREELSRAWVWFFLGGWGGWG